MSIGNSEALCDECPSGKQKTATTACLKCAAPLCDEHAARVLCTCRLEPHSLHSLCEDGEVYCTSCIVGRPMNRSSYVPAALLDDIEVQHEAELMGLQRQIGRLEAALSRPAELASVLNKRKRC